jgi:hypothetical protein
MDRERTLSALISRLEALSAREIIGNTKKTSLTRPDGASVTARAGNERGVEAAWAWFDLGGFLAGIMGVVERARR